MYCLATIRGNDNNIIIIIIRLYIITGYNLSFFVCLIKRYKDLYFSNTVKHTVREMLQKVFQTETGELREETRYAEGNEECTEAPAKKIPRKASPLLAMHNEILEENSEVIKDTGSRTALEIQSYLSEAHIPRSEQPLVYWGTNKSRFPALAEVARAYLSAPCTSVDSERLFSSASHVLDEKRNRLTCDKAEMLLFVKKNSHALLKSQK